MKTYARVDNGSITEILTTDLDIKTLFHPSISWVDITHEISELSVGWHYDGKTFTFPAIIEGSTLPETPAS